MRILALVATVLLVTSATAGVVPATTSAQTAGQYDGTHLTFGTEADALTDYRVDGTTYFDSIEVQSQQRTESDGLVGVGSDVGSITSLSGSALTVASRTETSATVSAESGATIETHDNTHGIATVETRNRTQYVQLNVTEQAEAGYEGDATVLVETESGATAALFVVGDGTVGVNGDGNVVAKVEDDGYLVVRTYDEERGTDDRNQEQLVSDAAATAEVYVMEQGGKRVVDTVTYGETTSVESTVGSDRVELTVDRPTKDGTIVLTSVPKELLAAQNGLSVTVDGKAAAEATTYSELPIAADGGQTSKYLVQQSSNTEATTEVAVALNHFSERRVTLADARGDEAADANASTTAEGAATADPTETESHSSSEQESTSTESPGFGFGVGVLAVSLLAVVALVRRRE